MLDFGVLGDVGLGDFVLGGIVVPSGADAGDPLRHYRRLRPHAIERRKKEAAIKKRRKKEEKLILALLNSGVLDEIYW